MSEEIVQKRRNELYGASRTDALRRMKGSLTEDHIHLLAQEGHNAGLPPWSSTTKTTYMGSQPRNKATSSLDSGMQKTIQNSSHFEFRGDSSPIDGSIYMKSLTNADYNHKNISKLPSMKLDPQINLPDMNPRYWKDEKVGESFYATDFSQMIKEHAGTPPVNQTSEIRRRNVRDLRNTHFHFGNDPSSFQTETASSFDTTLSRPRSGVRLDPLNPHQHRRAKTAPLNLSPAALVKKMLEEERESYVFRNGDYNVKAPKEDISTFSRDYNAMPKPNKAAAFVEPTQIPKGRFLQDAAELRGFLMEETMPWNTEEAPKTEVPESNISAMRQLFAQYDRKGTGFVSKPIMKRAIDSLLDPIPAEQVEHLLRFSRWGEDGSIDYNDFINKYIDMKPLKKPAEGDILGTFTPPKISRQDMSAGGASHGSPSLDNASLGKSYQTSVHFQFGSDKEKPSSIYNKDFDTGVKQDVVQSLKQAPPQSSEVMHTVPGVGFGASSKQSCFVDFHKVDSERMRQILDDRNQMVERNKRRHNLNSVIMTCDPNREAVDRQHSLSHTSYINHMDAKPEKPCEPHQPKYQYLKSDLALPFGQSLPKVSEARDAFSGPNLSNVHEEQAKLDEFKAENKERVKDGKRVHFEFGNDGLNHETEVMRQFTLDANVDDVMPAGKLNADDPHYAHLESSKNTRDLLGNPMAPNNIDRINMAKKSYYNALNPKDPLHVNLRRDLMNKDPEHTGHVTRRELKDVCNNFQINISGKAMERLVQKCDKHGDGSSIDYHTFVRALTMEQVPEDVSAAHSSSIMRQDYRPLEQRSFTDAQLLTISQMDKKPLKPQPSHFFHMDSTGDNGLRSMTNQDFIKPELQA